LTFQGTLGISQRYPNLRVLHKEHSGKGDSINQAMELSDTDVVLILDADTRLHPGSIRALRETFVRHPDVQVVSGTVIPSCAPSRLGRILQFFQQHEYARLHLWRLAWSHLNSSLIVSGACSAFRRQTLLDIGG
ncbi:MAG: glycosyltransferase family 2 protein, partial [Synechococcales cyanobacterium]